METGKPRKRNVEEIHGLFRNRFGKKLSWLNRGWRPFQRLLAARPDRQDVVGFLLSLPFLLVIAYLIGFGLFTLSRRPPAGLYLVPTSAEFFHDQFAEWTLKTDSAPLRSLLLNRTLWTWVEKDGMLVPTVGNIRKMKLSYDAKQDLWRARWPIPWNAPDGSYEVKLDTAGISETLPAIISRPFAIASRPFQTLPGGYGVLTLESLGSLTNLPAPDGTRKNYRALVDWAEFIGADAICVQGAESGGYLPKAPESFPWHMQNSKTLRGIGEECHRRGMQFGVYIISFLVGGSPEHSPKYDYGWTSESGGVLHGLKLRKRRGVSITDPKRPKDIIAALNRWREMPEVDFVGLDYIRPVFGGFELAKDFVREMPVEAPANWTTLSPEERMLWLLKNRVGGTDAFRDLWYWYRAHRSAQVVRTIKAGIGSTKPLWAFTLSWDKGWHHGQDPVMMRDAGIDYDAIMLYEATRQQFRGFVKQWQNYTSQKQLNLLVGDAIDWVLHQRTVSPSGPEDFYARNMEAATGFHSDGPTRGIFVHDFLRAYRGRLGPYSTREWMLAGGAAITQLRRLHDRLSYELTLEAPDQVTAHTEKTATIHFRSLSPASQHKRPATAVSVHLFSAPDVEVWPDDLELSVSSPTATFHLRWVPYEKSTERGNRSFVAARVQRTDSFREPCQIHVNYFQGERGPRSRSKTPVAGEELPPPLKEHPHGEELKEKP